MTEKVVVCLFCKYVGSNPEDVQAHIEKHHLDCPYPCDLCNYTTPSILEIYQHRKSVHTQFTLNPGRHDIIQKSTNVDLPNEKPATMVRIVPNSGNVGRTNENLPDAAKQNVLIQSPGNSVGVYKSPEFVAINQPNQVSLERLHKNQELVETNKLNLANVERANLNAEVVQTNNPKPANRNPVIVESNNPKPANVERTNRNPEIVEINNRNPANEESTLKNKKFIETNKLNSAKICKKKEKRKVCLDNQNLPNNATEGNTTETQSERGKPEKLCRSSKENQVSTIHKEVRKKSIKNNLLHHY